MRFGISWLVIVLGSQPIFAATYYVSPDGDDRGSGTTTDRAWKTCGKLNATAFAPGDKILFRRGGQWRGRLVASSDGAEKLPITYDAFGIGDRPRIFGSDILDNAAFITAGEHKFSCPEPAPADSALIDHVFAPSVWASGVLTITSASDPRTDGKNYTACIRGNVIFSNRKNHLVFRNLVVDETAGQLSDGAVQGYGIRIEGSSDVLVEDCEAYRCGRHHIAAINSTAFIGRQLRAGYVLPNTPGDNTPFVSYADGNAPVPHCTNIWDDIAADHLDDGKRGKVVSFVSHGDHLGPITIDHSVFDTKISLMSAPAEIRHATLRGSASIENFGDGLLIDSVSLQDSAAIDQWGSDGTIQNCIARLSPAGKGPTGYGSSIVIRAKARGNTIRFNTLVTGKFSCVELAGADSATRCFGNILQADGLTIAAASGTLGKTDLARADDNLYAVSATFAGTTFPHWQAMGFDGHSTTGDPDFIDPKTADFRPKKVILSTTDAVDVPKLDAKGERRELPFGIGALNQMPETKPR